MGKPSLPWVGWESCEHLFPSEPAVSSWQLLPKIPINCVEILPPAWLLHAMATYHSPVPLQLSIHLAPGVGSSGEEFQLKWFLIETESGEK